MAPTSGWYPDPAGSADLRYWDGQTWTRQTSALPAAPTPPAGPAVLAPPHIPQQSTAPAYEAYAGARAMPGSLAGRVPDKVTYGLPRARSRSFYGLLAGAVAVVVGAVFAIPPLMSSGHKHAGTEVLPQQPPASSSPIPQRSTTTNPSTSRYHLPEEFAGYPRITDSRATLSETDIMKDWPVSGPHVFGIYGNPTGGAKAMAILQTMSLTPAGDASLLKGVKEGFGSGISGLTWQNADTGDYGGAMQCGTTTQGAGAAICVFADATTFGFTLVFGDPYDGEPAAVQLRNESEAIPPAPQPDASQTVPDPDPQNNPAIGSTGGRTA
jgi:hypothetical protein